MAGAVSLLEKVKAMRAGVVASAIPEVKSIAASVAGEKLPALPLASLRVVTREKAPV
ncbi:hypothetical protein D3C72_2479230 [compost metagenome]